MPPRATICSERIPQHRPNNASHHAAQKKDKKNHFYLGTPTRNTPQSHTRRDIEPPSPPVPRPRAPRSPPRKTWYETAVGAATSRV
ncbi:hypothetical protein PMIN01_10123 [Paraphaeosphaeria minitans]|uniref:Uncharacterized protein n=1 Tax=Paraphaeosphaeria minitans TaxID=565426 RepID=A0A9P6GB66_9PLEO|nr:hypothetical protein PMIN01_10123 [Paraphaeosphaeria minitans]